jgi:hypothetical protein
MTPTATTPAARRGVKARAATTKSGSATRPVAAPGHRRTASPSPAPRRVSGPAGGRSAAAGATARRTRPSVRSRASLGARAVAYVRAMPDHALLDRLIRGRAWIPVLGVMLAGIVAMQVEVLKLGATMGRAIDRGTALQSRNEILRDSVASLEDEQRIVRLAAGYGMVMPSPGDVGFLRARTANVNRAAADIKAPDAAAFSALLSSNGAIAQTPTAPAPSAATPATATPSTAAPSTAAPSTAAPSTAAPSSGTPSTGTPSTGAPSSGTTSGTPLSAGTTAATAAVTGGGAPVTGG